MTVNNAKLQVEIDTGSALTPMSQATYSSLWPEELSSPVLSTTVRLRTYSGEELKVLRRVVVEVRYGGQVVEGTELVVVGGGGPSLLGRDWLWVGLGWIGGRFEVFATHPIHSIAYLPGIPNSSKTNSPTDSLRVYKTTDIVMRCLPIRGGGSTLTSESRTTPNALSPTHQER